MSKTLTPELCKAVVQDIIKLTEEKYVFPDLGTELAQLIQAKLERGHYDAIIDASELALVLTEDLRAASNDRHWYIAYDPQQAAEQIDPETEKDAAHLARWLAQARRNNFGFARIERSWRNRDCHATPVNTASDCSL